MSSNTEKHILLRFSANSVRYRSLKDVDSNIAIKTFEDNRDFYHPICRGMVEKDLYGKT